MTAAVRRILAVALLLLFAGCGGRAVEVRTAQSVPVTVAPPTTTIIPETTTTTTVTPTTKEPPMPDGARHGDQQEVVERFAAIDGSADCDTLRAEQAADLTDRDGMLTVHDGWHRSRAELDERYAEAAHHRMAEAGCYTMAHTE